MCQHSFLSADLDKCHPSHMPSSIFSSRSSTCISRLCLIITHNVSHSSSADVFGSTPSLLTHLILCSFSGFFFSLQAVGRTAVQRKLHSSPSLFGTAAVHEFTAVALKLAGSLVAAFCVDWRYKRTARMLAQLADAGFAVTTNGCSISSWSADITKITAALPARPYRFKIFSISGCTLDDLAVVQMCIWAFLCEVSVFSLFLSLVLFSFSMFRQQSKNIYINSIKNSNFGGGGMSKPRIFWGPCNELVTCFRCHLSFPLYSWERLQKNTVTPEFRKKRY